ncbi:MAG: hypothetical protein AAGG51_30475 [Cyanobacteria bacterium P01_G01_bin.54]
MQKRKLGQFFQDGNEQFSATRLAFLVWIFGTLIVWSAGSLQAKEMQDIPDSVTVLVGILMTGKVAQRVNEASGSDKASGPQTAKPKKPVEPSLVENGAAHSF